MTDEAIIRLYFQREEQAISHTQRKFGPMLRSIAYNILRCTEDAAECENDTYMKAWNSIPPAIPKKLGAYLGAIDRNLAIGICRKKQAAKRQSGYMCAIEELEECIPGGSDPAEEVQAGETALEINDFLASLPKNERVVFMQRYWMCMDIKQISTENGYSQSKVKTMLFRTRKKLKKYLTERSAL